MIPLDGPIADGEFVSLGWPEPAEYDLITALRNRPAVRACFLDPRPLDIVANREWIARRMKRPHEGLLSIRCGTRRDFCGTIGWSGYVPEQRTFEIGRLIVDAARVRPHRASFPPAYQGIALDASATLLQFAFDTMQIDYVTSFFLADRSLPRRVNLLSGGRPMGDVMRERPDGSRVLMTSIRCTREDWLASRSTRSARAGSSPKQDTISA